MGGVEGLTVGVCQLSRCNGKNSMQLRQSPKPLCFLYDPVSTLSYPPFPPCVPPFTTPSIFPLVRCSYAPFNVQQNALFATTAASASNATFRRKWWVVKRGAEWKGWWKWAILTDRQHGWVFTLQLLCQSADLSIYINLLSSAIVVAAVVVYVTEAVAFSRNLQANFVSVAYHSKPPTPATGTTAR